MDKSENAKRKGLNVVLILVITGCAILLGIILKIKNNSLEKNNIEIIDATYACANNPEKFYEDNKYIYYFPCKQSSSVFVKFPNGNKLLVTRALEDKKVTINQLIKAGLKVNKKEK